MVVANWKMNPATIREAKRLFEATGKAAKAARSVSVVVAPPAPFLGVLARGYRGKIGFAIQNAHFEAGGAHTGEVSMGQAEDVGASFVIIGHAERREMGESDEDIRKKVAAALSARLTPILCVGERERKHGEYFNVIREQLRIALADTEGRAHRVIIVYEPLWTIGKDTAMSPSKMHEMAIFIRKTVVELHGEIGHNMKILYGGSVNDKDAGAMLREGDVKGFLVGRASIDAEEFASLLQVMQDA